jgi:hypothetical protein
MAKPLPDPDGDDAGIPRWVKVFAIVAAILAMAFIVMHLSGGGMMHHAP